MAKSEGEAAIMKRIASSCLAALLLGGGSVGSAALSARAAEGRSAAIRVLVVTGGHPYDTNEFRAVFTRLPDIEARFVAHPEAEEWLRPDRADAWDVLLTYDMWQPLTEQTKADFVARLKEGKGLVATHHSLANYQDWPLYAEIVGARYHLTPWKQGRRSYPASTYKHDLDLLIQVLNPWHPVTRGMEDFVIHDEGYGALEYRPSICPLLAARDPESSPVVAWCHRWRGARVVGIQLGHDHQAYENAGYRRLMANAIRWAAGKSRNR
jgi:type 1 glutamine amidotransferase